MMNNLIAASGPAVEVEDLHVRRGRNVVFDGLDVTIPRGAIVGLLGPSGCGKTTLMRSIVGAQRTRSGMVRVLGEPAGSKRLRRRVAYGTQGAAVYGDLSVRQNVRYFASLVGATRDAADRTVDQVGLGSQAGQLVESLSGGQATRVSLAIALVGDPELVVLDEPTVGLDPLIRAELWEMFEGLARRGVTMLVSSHVMDEALHCDRLLLMREGVIIADTTPDQLLADTGEQDPEAAFLALVRGSAKSTATRAGAAEERAEERAEHAARDGAEHAARDGAGEGGAPEGRVPEGGVQEHGAPQNGASTDRATESHAHHPPAHARTDDRREGGAER